MAGNSKQAQATMPVHDLIASMRRSGELLHSPASRAEDGTLTPTGERALDQLEDAIAELLSDGVKPAGLPDLQGLAIYSQARVTFAKAALGHADFDRAEGHLHAALALLGKLSSGLAELTGTSAERFGIEKLN